MDIRPNLMPPDGFRGGGAPFRVVEHSGGGGPSTLAWVIFALLLVLLALAIASLVIDAYYRRRAERTASGPTDTVPTPNSKAQATLDARYARGAISREEYLQAREDLRGSADATTQVIPPDPEPNAA